MAVGGWEVPHAFFLGTAHYLLDIGVDISVDIRSGCNRVTCLYSIGYAGAEAGHFGGHILGFPSGLTCGRPRRSCGCCWRKRRRNAST